MPRVCITVHGKNAQPYRFSLDRKVIRIGRSADCDIVVDCRSVSSHHCEMRRIDGGYVLEDTGSTNGIKLDGDRMDVIDLENGLDIHVGDAALDFDLSEEELEKLEEEDHTPQQRAQLPKAKEAAKASRRPTPAPTTSAGPIPPRPNAATLLSTSRASGSDTAITLGLITLAILAFYFGLASAHKSKYGSDTKGFWNDIWSDTPLPAQKES